jgi:hypothetical protein
MLSTEFPTCKNYPFSRVAKRGAQVNVVGEKFYVIFMFLVSKVSIVTDRTINVRLLIAYFWPIVLKKSTRSKGQCI